MLDGELDNLRPESVCEWHLLARGREREAILHAWRFYPRDALDPRDDIHNSRVFCERTSLAERLSPQRQVLARWCPI